MCGQHLSDGGAVLIGSVKSNALQCVDAGHCDLGLVIAELINRMGKPLSDLCPTDLLKLLLAMANGVAQLPPAKRAASQDAQASQPTANHGVPELDD